MVRSEGANGIARHMHVGGTVPDLDEAIADHAPFGIERWAVSEHLDLWTYDGSRETVTPQPVRMAYGRLPGGSAIELIEPAACDPVSPQRRLLAERPGISHAGYWCTDLPRAAGHVLERGARVFTIAVGHPDQATAALAAGGEAALIAATSACYLVLRSGALVELVATRVYGDPFESMLPGISEILDPPDV